MIGKVIWMRSASAARTSHARRKAVASTIMALSVYVVDARPHDLVSMTHRDILSLTDYAVAVRENGMEPGEKVVAFGTRNLLGSDLREWQTQMLATCAVAP